MDTHLIRKSDVERALTMEDCLKSTEQAFRYYGNDAAQMPPKSYLYFEKDAGDLRCMPAYIGEIGAAGIKAVNVHPNNHKVGLPTVMATILLIDPHTGFLLAVMDGTHITSMRTGAAGGVAAKYLAKENCRRAAFIGAGMQAETQVAAMVIARPGVKDITIFDINEERAGQFARHCESKYSLKTTVSSSVHHACANADIINCTTSARQPIVLQEDVPAGAHINAIGADAIGKQELHPDILKSALVVIDDWVQASHSGEINLPVAQGLFKQSDVAAEMGTVVAKNKKVRQSDSDITVFDSTGLAIQDLVTAWHVYKLIEKSGRLENLQAVRIFD